MKSRLDAPAPVEEWEVRPCGMLVQKRNPDDGDAPVARIPTIRIKVKHGSASHEIYISSQATFGEVKKALSARTGLHPLDQKLIYKDKERDSAAFLDTAGVKDKSKLVLVEDSVAQAKRLLEQRKNEKMERASKLISAISKEVDKLASKVSALEAIVSKGGRVVENDVVNLIELLMNELIKLDGVDGDGDVKLQRRVQVKRVQKYIETLDAIKAKNARNVPKLQAQTPLMSSQNEKYQQTNVQYQQHQPQKVQTNSQHRERKQVETLDPIKAKSAGDVSKQQAKAPIPSSHNEKHQKISVQYQQHQHQKAQTQFQQPQQAATKTDWDIFDSLFATTTTTNAQATATATARLNTTTSTSITRFDWELF